MKVKYWAFPLLLSTMAMLTGCMSEADADTSTDTNTDKPLATTIVAGEFTVAGLPENRKIEVYKNQSAFDAALYNFLQPLAETNIDFSANQVVLLSLGERPSGGYSIAVTDLEETTDYVKVSVLYSFPGSDCVVTTVVSSPYLFAKIDTTKDLIFEEKIESKSCGD